MDGCRLLTDPVLVQRVLHLRRYSAPAPAIGPVDAVLISHAHQDHLDFRSLRRIGRGTHIVAPRGCGSMLRRRGFRRVDEVDVGQSIRIGSARCPRDSGRPPHEAPALRRRVAVRSAMSIEGEQRIAFLGDTDLLDEMAHLGSGLDVALVPIWGWGPSIGAGHLDPERAALAMQMLQPRIAIPIHWGTLAPQQLRSRRLTTSLGPDPSSQGRSHAWRRMWRPGCWHPANRPRLVHTPADSGCTPH